MLDTHLLKSLLKVNTSSAEMTQSEVSGVLGKAGWTQSEIDSALVLLGHDAGGEKISDTSALAQGFRPDMDFSSSQISNLLGVDVVLDPESVRILETRQAVLRDTALKILAGLAVVCISLGLALGIGIASAHYLDVDLSPLSALLPL